MAFLLGIDTGGTFTDAAVLDTGSQTGNGSAQHSTGTVVAKAKSLTTRHDLAIGIAGAAQQALVQSPCDPGDIGLVSLSTTLATNALVEGQGGRVALVAIGFEERDLKNAGLSDALGGDPVVLLQGGHNTHGGEAAPLDLSKLEEIIADLAPTVSGFAVAGYFAVRNPAHELAVKEYLIEKTAKAVTCSHELSARLNGPKRALTTVLNARLVPMITKLISATKRTLEENNIKAPIMVVRGDGALVSADFAVNRPIETILSGPAASLVGARFLTGLDRAFVNDIGGTTSDVAILEDGRPRLDPDGAMVGGFRTMVEAVAMYTYGLGGDSEVGIGGTGLNPQLTLGPKRLVPVSLVAKTFGEIVHKALDGQLKSILNGRFDGQFAFRSGSGIESGLSVTEAKLFDSLSDVPVALEGFLQGNAQAAALQKLVGRGLVQIAGLTPSDAMHALGHHEIWDKDAATKALKLFGRKRDGGGKPLFEDPLDLAAKIIARVERRSAEVVLQTAYQIEGRDGLETVSHPLVQEVLDGRAAQSDTTSMVNLSLNMDRPLIGLGASAHAYHPNAAKLLGTDAIVPDDAGVANAIGAVVGQISMTTQVTVSQPADGRFQVTEIEQPFAEENSALEAAQSLVQEKVRQLAQEAGAEEIDVSVNVDAKRAVIESRDTLIEAIVSASATGRPPIVG